MSRDLDTADGFMPLWAADLGTDDDQPSGLGARLQPMPPERTLGEKTWDQRVFEQVPSGVDVALIQENLRLTPSARVEKMMRALDLVMELRAAYANRPPHGT